MWKWLIYVCNYKATKKKRLNMKLHLKNGFKICARSDPVFKVFCEHGVWSWMKIKAPQYLQGNISCRNHNIPNKPSFRWWRHIYTEPGVRLEVQQLVLLFISYKFVKGFLAITFLLLVISSWNVHGVCRRFLYNKEHNFILIRRKTKTKNFPI